ncbi:DNA-directed RNA polymerase III subunit RPC3-like [Daphnia carinata]|uniref:DNA-directed RNA polymerase III subunit RPC3-like n=1 Tax=Daphnia carinata TaxID=120202 RepID=UPI00257F2879|nr:DNA-directed RNA polymerase III subunit RPC3-like [Daphnia carinata]
MPPFTLGHFSQVCCQLLNHYFGEIVGQVGAYLLRRGHRPLFDIPCATGLSIAEVMKALAVMVQHNLVKFEASERNNNIAEYSVIPHNVYCLLRYPKYLYMIKRIYGTSEEILLEVLLNLGQASASNVIFQSANRLKEANDDSEISDPSTLHQSFLKLAQDNFIIRCPKLADNANMQKVPTLVVEEKEKFTVPHVEIGPIAKLLKENATQLGEHGDSEVIWRVNHDRFDVELRNVILVNAAARRVDATAGELYHLILKLWRECSNPDSPTTNALSFNVIKDAVRKNEGSSPILLEHFEQYLRVLYEDTSSLIVKVGDAGGGQFILNYSTVFENLACATLDSIVLERFGSKALRLFRLTRIQKFMEQDQMQNIAMIPAKEAKMFTYKLLEHNFLQIKELKKGTSNFAPVKSFILFHVDLPQVARTSLEASYKGLFNAMVRQMHDLTDNKRLLDKHTRLETLLETLRGEGLPEDELAYLSDSMTAAEKSLVAKIHSMNDQLTLGQTQVDETILILESYLKFSSMT